MQAMKDLRELYGDEVDSDENVVQKKPKGADTYNEDSDSEGVEVLAKNSKAFKGKAVNNEEILKQKIQRVKDSERFKAYMPKRVDGQFSQMKGASEKQGA